MIAPDKGHTDDASVPLRGRESWREVVEQLRKHLTDRGMVIATVSRWIQSSPEAWRNCFKTIAALVTLHFIVQTWCAFPFPQASDCTKWHAARRLYLAQLGFTLLSALVSLHVQICGLAGTEGIVPFPQHAAERIRRVPPMENFFSWQRIYHEPVRWIARCASVFERRWWALGCNIDPRYPYDWWRMPGNGLTDEKLTFLCWLGEFASVLVILISLCEGPLLEAMLGAGRPRTSYYVIALATEFTLGISRLCAIFFATVSYKILKGCMSVFATLQWDTLLVECGFLALVLAIPCVPNCWLPALLLPQQVCVFKCMFGSGIVKRRSRCPRWAASTAMDLHYETQPIPHMVSWYAHKLPRWVHAQECWVAFLVQLPLTFLQWGPWRCRQLVFAGYVGLMTAISATGSYGFFNFQVAGQAVSILDDGSVPLPSSCLAVLGSASVADRCWWSQIIAVALLPCISALGLWVAAGCGFSLFQLPHIPVPMVGKTPTSFGDKLYLQAQRAHQKLHALGVGHSYGPFAGMTTFRWELIFELSSDGVEWSQLEFPYKPGCINARIRWMPLGHFARLDWRLWFVPLGMSRGRWELPDWVEGFIAQLLVGSESVASLTMQRDSIVASPPRYVRISVWDYHFTSCDPSVHCCPQVTLTCAERDVAYQALAALETHESLNGCLTSPCSGSTEWGQWWYRRLVKRIGVYYGHNGQLQFQADQNQ